MNAPLELMSKLGLKSGEKLWLINAPREMAEELAAGAEIEMVHEKDEYDGVIAYFDSAAEAELLTPRILAELPPDGRLWIGGAESGAVEAAGWHSAEAIDIGDGRSLRRFAKR
jgi:hypothetical protein